MGLFIIFVFLYEAVLFALPSLLPLGLIFFYFRRHGRRWRPRSALLLLTIFMLATFGTRLPSMIVDAKYAIFDREYKIYRKIPVNPDTTVGLVSDSSAVLYRPAYWHSVVRSYTGGNLVHELEWSPVRLDQYDDWFRKAGVPINADPGTGENQIRIEIRASSEINGAIIPKNLPTFETVSVRVFDEAGLAAEFTNRVRLTFPLERLDGKAYQFLYVLQENPLTDLLSALWDSDDFMDGEGPATKFLDDVFEIPELKTDLAWTVYEGVRTRFSSSVPPINNATDRTLYNFIDCPPSTETDQQISAHSQDTVDVTRGGREWRITVPKSPNGHSKVYRAQCFDDRTLLLAKSWGFRGLTFVIFTYDKNWRLTKKERLTLPEIPMKTAPLGIVQRLNSPGFRVTDTGYDIDILYVSLTSDSRGYSVYSHTLAEYTYSFKPSQSEIATER